MSVSGSGSQKYFSYNIGSKIFPFFSQILVSVGILFENPFFFFFDILINHSFPYLPYIALPWFPFLFSQVYEDFFRIATNFDPSGFKDVIQYTLERHLT